MTKTDDLKKFIERLNEILKNSADSIGYEEFNLSDISKEVNFENKKIKDFEDLPNSVYLPTIGNSPVVSSLSELNIKPQNYMQILLDEDIAHAPFVAYFLNTPPGLLFRESLLSGKIIPKITKSNLLISKIYLPELNKQKKIVDVRNKLIDISSEISILDRELYNFQGNIEEIDDKVTFLLETAKLTNSDNINMLISKGENIDLEFKSSLRIDKKTKKLEDHIKHSVLKTVVAFLNTGGGTLLVGVSDDGTIIGLEDDKFESGDKILLYTKDIIKGNIGFNHMNHIKLNTINTHNKIILKIDCKPGDNEAFLKLGKKEEFFIRTGPSTEKLEGRDLTEYVKRRF